MGTPAGLTAVNRIDFALSRLGGPQRRKVIIIIFQSCELFAQFTRADISVVIDPGDCFAGGTGEWPRRGTIEVTLLRSIVSRNRAHIGDVLHETPGGIIFSKHTIAIPLRKFR